MIIPFVIFIKNGSLLYTYHGSGPIFQLQWSPRGDKLAACVSDTTVSDSRKVMISLPLYTASVLYTNQSDYLICTCSTSQVRTEPVRDSGSPV